MSSYLFKDSVKSAFINGVNKLYAESKINKKISSNDIIDNPPGEGIEFSLYTVEEPEMEQIVDDAIKDGYFSFDVKKINLKSIIKELVGKKLSSVY